MRLGKSLQHVFTSGAVMAAIASIPVSAHASMPPECYDCAISFAQAGTVTVDLLSNEGLFDHVLQVTSGAGGSVPSPIFALLSTDLAYSSRTTLGGDFSPDSSSKSFAYAGGYLALTFALFSYDPSQSGTPLATVISSGSSNGTGVVGGAPLSFVQGLGTNSVTVHMTDLFAGTYPDDLRNLEFQVTLAPVPEPHEWAMMLAGLGVVGVVARRRRHTETT